MAAASLDDVSGEAFCYITTIGRRSGRPHTIEIWFVVRDDTAYILMGGGDRADTVRNLQADPAAGLRIDGRTWDGLGRVVTDAAEASFVRRALPEKYAAYEDELEEWAETALPVAIDVSPRRNPASPRLKEEG